MNVAVRIHPVIIMGMHRSGTTLLARLLTRLGLFLGAHVEQNHEAIFFLHVNNVLLSQARAAWDHPTPFLELLDNPEIVEMTLRCLRRDLLSWRIHRYLGWRNVLRYRSLTRFDRPWGWKDPRNVFTLPLWVKLFPHARILYVVRNGVDVARSLLVREEHYLRWQWSRFFERFSRFTFGTHLERVGFRGSVRCLTLHGAFTLWEEYVAHAERVLREVTNERRIVRYEEFVCDPLPLLRELCDFCGLSGVREDALENATQEIRTERAYAFTSDPTLVEFFSHARESLWMRRLGYASWPISLPRHRFA